MPELTELEPLRDGWNGPGSLAPTPAAIATYKRVLAAVANPNHPNMEPVADPDSGGLALEWKTGDTQYEVDFWKDGTAYLHMSEPGRDAEEHITAAHPRLVELVARFCATEPAPTPTVEVQAGPVVFGDYGFTVNA